MKHTPASELEMRDNIFQLRMILGRTRDWHGREQESSYGKMHPAIRTALSLYRPDRWQEIVLEWPHLSDSDPSRVAYTQSEQKGEADIQTVTSIGKYIKRHFTYMPDHTIRDIAARYSGHSFEIVRTMPEILAALRDAPQSCMNNYAWKDDNIDWDDHPYNVYAPKYGWGLAISKRNGAITGRCLINDESMTFVRSYNDGREFSHSSEGIEMWLKENGYTKACDWTGNKIALLHRRNSYGSMYLLAPYLDGDAKDISLCESEGYCEIVDSGDGEFVCDRTDGRCDESHDCTCDDCGEGFCEDEGIWIGENDETHVCNCCADNYVLAIGYRGREYYVSRDDTVYVDSQDSYFHDSYLDTNGIVFCEDTDDYEHKEHALYLSTRNCWVTEECDEAVYCEDTGDHEHIDDCVMLHDGTYALITDATQCEHSDEWYLDSDNIEWVITENGLTVHPDHAHNYETENESV